MNPFPKLRVGIISKSVLFKVILENIPKFIVMLASHGDTRNIRKFH